MYMGMVGEFLLLGSQICVADPQHKAVSESVDPATVVLVLDMQLQPLFQCTVNAPHREVLFILRCNFSRSQRGCG